VSGPEGLRAAGHALRYWEQRQSLNMHNLANVETAGYRARRIFAQLTEGGIPAVGTAVDPTAGALRETGGALDLALSGAGSFVVRSVSGEEHVRSGSFSLDGEGRVIDRRGRQLLAEGGALVLPPGPVEIDPRGVVTVAGERVATLRVEAPPAPPEGGSAGDAGPAGGGARAAAEATREVPDDGGEAFSRESVIVRQGALEGANVSPLEALIEMTNIQKSYAAVQSTVRTFDSALDTIVNRIGRVG